jgi:putative nucleotidyltransferase with HDIG domain
MSSCHPVILSDLSKVPPFPPLAARLLELLKDPEVDVGEVAEIISNDVKLTARLLQSSNSALFGMQTPVSNVRQAVALLGYERTLQIVVMNAAAAFTRRAPSTAELLSCWQHSIATALIADEIARSCEVFTKAAFTTGILHDIGRLGLIVAYPREYERVMCGATTESCLDLLDFEREHFGIDHAEAGRLLAETWDLPEEFRIVAGRHHDPCEGTELDLLRIIHVACRLADVFGYGMFPPPEGSSIDAILKELPQHARQHLLKNPEEFHAQIEKHISAVL